MKRVHGFIVFFALIYITNIVAYNITPLSVPHSEPYNIETDAKKIATAHTTFIVYMAADNDLRVFAARNINQMAEIGSNENIHIAIHLDIKITGNKKITRRYYIAGKNKVLHMNADDPSTQAMDSGQPATLISACKWAIESFPAKEYVLVFWNHGTGVIDPVLGKILNPTKLFSYNPALNLLELDRSTSILGDIHLARNQHSLADLLLFLDKRNKEAAIDWQEIEHEMINIDDPKGICWDDSTGNYLTNQKLDEALTIIRRDCLHNSKFAIIAFDACLMSMIEIQRIIAAHADIMVSSQEVELGTGWNYEKVLKPFAHKPLGKKEFAYHIVQAYQETYHKITNDYTQSAIALKGISTLEKNINDIAILLIEALQIQKNKTVINALRASKNKLVCTHFDEPSYVDLDHLYTNIEQNLKLFSFVDQNAGAKIITNLQQLLAQGHRIIAELVIANVCGKNLRQARGISIYFPERIHSSYPKSSFALSNSWLQLLYMYTRG